MTIIEMRDKRTKLLATMDGFLETHRNEKGVLSAEDDATYAGMEKDLAALTNEIKRMERRGQSTQICPSLFLPPSPICP